MLDQRDLVAFACRLMHRLGLAPSHASTRVPQTAFVAVKARGGNAAATTPEDVIVVDLEGALVAGSGRPPAELPLHVEIYRRRADVLAIAHTHQPLATAVLDAVPRDDVPTFDYSGLIDTTALGAAMAAQLGAAGAIHLRSHGFAIAGSDLEEVVARALELEGHRT